MIKENERMLANLRLWQKIVLGAFLAFCAVWFILFHTADMDIKTAYAVIVVSFVFTLQFLWRPEDIRVQALSAVALFFTCIADIFLVFLADGTGKYESLGVTVFIIVQLIYFVRIHLSPKERQGFADVGGDALAESGVRSGKLFGLRKKETIISVAVRAALFAAVCVIAAVVFKGTSAFEDDGYLIIAAIFYIVNSAVNIAFSALRFKENALLPAGLFFLLVCDVIIGLNFLGAGMAVNQWTFYLISQPLLAVSALISY